MKTRIDEVIETLCAKQSQVIEDNGNPAYRPEFTVYMEYDFWLECKKELVGQIPSLAYEFLTNDKLMGFQVWRILPVLISSKEQIQHQPYRIVNLDE